MAMFGKKKQDGEGRAQQPPASAGLDRTRAGATPRPGPTGQTVKRAEQAQDEGPGPGRNKGGGHAPSTRGGAVASIGKSIIFKGELTGSEDLEIDGMVEGDIKLPDHVLTIGPNGRVKASVNAKCVQIIGQITGNVNATERVEIQASGIVQGDIRSPKLLVQEGAVVNGAIEMTDKAGGRPVEKPAAATPTTGQTAERKAG